MTKKSKPNDIAIALRYDGSNTPTVTAKGCSEHAEQIRALAKEHNIPIKYEPILAQVLSHVELGDVIPESLYVAVAEVIAFAYILSDKISAIPEYIPANKYE